MGTSSSLFNTLLTGIDSASSSNLFSAALQKAIQAVLTAIGQADNDIADYPNPFYHYHDKSNPVIEDIQLTLVDGGEDGQNIPFHPLIQPYR
jgi:lysophospholipase